MKNQIQNESEAVKAVEKVEEAVTVDVNQERAAAALDAIQGVRRADKLPESVRVRAEAPLLEELKEAIVAIGSPVARGNALYVVTNDNLHQVSIDAKSLVRL